MYVSNKFKNKTDCKDTSKEVAYRTTFLPPLNAAFSAELGVVLHIKK